MGSFQIIIDRIKIEIHANFIKLHEIKLQGTLDIEQGAFKNRDNHFKRCELCTVESKPLT